MLNIEKQISNLVANQFPAVYREQGEQLIAFVQAYYEWMETNCQLLEVANATGFSVGDIVSQGPAGGEILAVDGRKLLVLSTRRLIDLSDDSALTSFSTMDSQALVGEGSSVATTRIYDASTDSYSTKTYDRSSYTQALRGAEMFACMRFCDSLTPIQSSSGSQTSILKAFNSSTTLIGRSVAEYNDIDLTVDRFIVHFKEKYLSNIEFDVATNKRLLIKNALNLYRAKGTSRAVDLLFKLVYGTEAVVYTPGDDIFRLSDGEYIKPIYLEVSNSPILVDVVGKVVTGAVSGATGFVENYIRRRVNNNFVHILYISGLTGQFVNREPLSVGSVYEYNNPRVVGSLKEFEIVTGSSGFSVGDTVSIVADTGTGGLARVASVSSVTGLVDFDLIDGGWGYTTNADSIVSEKVISLSNVVVSNTSITDDYMAVYENLFQYKLTVQYNAGVANSNFATNTAIYFANSSANTGSGLVISSTPTSASNGSLLVLLNSSNTGAVVANNKIFLTSNNLLIANSVVVTNSTVGSKVTGVSNTVTLSLGSISNGQSVSIGLGITQGNTIGIIASVSQSGANAAAVVSIANGSFVIGTNVVIGGTFTANVANQIVSVGVHSVNATFSSGFAISTSCTAVSATITNISSGALADFSIGTVGETEDVFINTDLLSANNTSNVPHMSIALNAAAYGFDKAPGGNSATIMFQVLNFDDFSLGTIASLTGINPGADYNVDPFVLARQPFISGFDRKDLIINIANTSSAFTIGERIVQTNANLTFIALGVANSAGFTIGENIRQGSGPETANGTISAASNTSLIVRNVQGTFNTSSNVFSRISTANVAVANVTTQSVASTAKAIIKTANTSVITAKRIQFENTWTAGTQLVGQSSGATANVVSVVEDQTTLPIGLNANITANVVTGEGAVSSLQILDSGFGYTNGELASFVSSDGIRAGLTYLIRNGQGLSVGYWRSNKGMLSTDKYLLDSDFYQEYSYQIISRIPFDKYRGMVLDVLHVAGTKLFGAVQIDSNIVAPITHIESSITN